MQGAITLLIKANSVKILSMSKINKGRSASSRVGGFIRGVAENIPLGIPPVLRRFWRFTRDNSKQFAKHLNDPEKSDKELTKAVVKKFKS